MCAGVNACVRDAGRDQAGKAGLHSEDTRPTKGAHAQELSQSLCIAEPVNQNGGRGCSHERGKGTALSPSPRAKQSKRKRVGLMLGGTDPPLLPRERERQRERFT